MTEFRSQVIQAYWKARSEHEERQRHDWKGVVSDENPAPLAAAEAALLAVRAQMEWQPIETAPEDRACVLWVPNRYPNVVIGAYWKTDDQARWGWWACASQVTPTHWMPLPSPPGSPSILDTALAALRQEEK